MNSNLFRGSLETIIIKLLKKNGKMYGYEITKTVKEISGGQLNLTEGALYPALHKMEASGLLDVESVLEGNRYRKYYSLTKKGKSELKVLIEDMENYIQTMQLLLAEKSYNKQYNE